MDPVDKFKIKIEREMKSGFISLLVLYIINESAEPIHGYKIIQNLNITTKGNLEFKEGTVYPILKYLQTQQFVKSYLEESPQGAPRKCYVITKLGKRALTEGLTSWKQFRSALNKTLKDLEVRS